jgi:hypothetical protein
MQKGSDCEIFSDPVYFVLKFPKRVNYSYFHYASSLVASRGPITKPSKKNRCRVDKVKAFLNGLSKTFLE